jgi:hypothetical protein
MQEATRFRDSSVYAIATIAALAAGAVFDIWIVLSDGKHFQEGAAGAAVWIRLHAVLRFATACAFLTWFDRVYGNLIAIRGSTKHSRWWAIGGFFLPPFALFRPCEIAVEVWRSTSRRDGHPIVVYLWWAAFLQMIVLFVVGRPMYIEASVLAAGLAIAMVRILSAQIEAAHLEMQTEERRILREKKTATALRAPQPPSAPTAGIAPHLAAIEAAAAALAAERRATATWSNAKAGEPQPEPMPEPPPVALEPPPAAASPILPAPPVASPAAMAAPRRLTVPASQQPARAAVGDSLWILLVSIALGVTGVASMMMAVRVGFGDDPVSHLIGAIYLATGTGLAFFAALIARHRSAESPDDWSISAIAAIVVAGANIVVIAWFVAP